MSRATRQNSRFGTADLAATRGAASGVAGLDASQKLLEANVPDRLSDSGLTTSMGAQIETTGTPAHTATVALVDASVDAAAVADKSSTQGMVEYRWILPTSVYIDEPYRHTFCASLGNKDSAGAGYTNVLVTEVSHESGAVAAYVIGSVPNDDHNAPSIITAPGDPILVQWTHHGGAALGDTDPGKNLMYYKVGLPDRPDTLVNAPLQTADMGSLTAYGQAWKVNSLSNDTKVVYYRLYRRNLVQWYVLKEEVNRATGVVTTNAPGYLLADSSGLQCYVTTATGSRDSQIVRFAFGLSPASDPDWVAYFELNLATGDITSPVQTTLAANLVTGTNMPITDPDHGGPQFLPNLTGAKATYERRLLAVRPWPAAFGVLTAEGDPADRPGTGHYWLNEWAGAYTSPSTGPVSPVNGLIAKTGSPSYAKATDVPLADGATQIKATYKIKLPATKPTNAYLDVGGQQDGDSDGWYLWVGATTNELKLRMFVNRVGGTSNLTSTAVLAGVTWGDTVYVRVTYNPATVGGYRCVMESSLDGTTWTNIGNIVGNSGAMVVASTAYTWFGVRAAGRAPSSTDYLAVQYAKLEINSGSGLSTRTELDLTSDSAGALNWPGYALTHTDAQTRHWTLVGAAVIGRSAYGPTIPSVPVPVTYDLSATGPTLWASYYPGAAFIGVSVILARQNGSNEELVLCYVDSTGTVRSTVLRTQPTSQGRFFRPMPPDNGGPLWCWLVNSTAYGSNDYFDWTSGLKAIRRL